MHDVAPKRPAAPSTSLGSVPTRRPVARASAACAGQRRPPAPAENAARILDAVYLPPAAQGDVFRAASNGAQAIGIVDGGRFDRFRQPDDHVGAQFDTELRVDDGLDRIAEEVSHDYCKVHEI